MIGHPKVGMRVRIYYSMRERPGVLRFLLRQNLERRVCVHHDLFGSFERIVYEQRESMPGWTNRGPCKPGQIMPHQRATGTVVVVPKRRRRTPLNIGVQLDTGEFTIIPRGNLILEDNPKPWLTI